MAVEIPNSEVDEDWTGTIPSKLAVYKKNIDNTPTVDAIPKERIEQMVQEIANLSIVSNYGENITGEMAQLYSFKRKAISIIHKYTKEQNNE